VAVSNQIGDQTLKGAVVGVVAYVLNRLNVGAEAQAAFLPLVLWALALVSTKVGDPNVASFLAKAPELKPEIEAEVAKKKAPAKKAPAKKA
jgi:hypothetical protein